MASDIQIIYVLAPAFSGTTLFSLALGGFEDVLNLGEVSALENDYVGFKKCTCGQTLDDCSFWKKLSSCIDCYSDFEPNFSLSSRGTGEKLDSRYSVRSNWENVKRLISRSAARSFYDESYIRTYQEKNKNFFLAVRACFPNYTTIVDCSKNVDRLTVLETCPDLNFFVILLRRNPAAIYASSLRRFEKRRKSRPMKRLPIFFAKIIYSIWLRRSIERVYSGFEGVDENRKMVVLFEDFVDNPRAILEQVKQKCGITGKWVTPITAASQHLYVGNRWIFSDPNDPIEFKLRDYVETLSWSDKVLMKLLF
jgi:hypothetical protein